MTDNRQSKIKIMRICPAPGYLQKFRDQQKLHLKTYNEQIKILQQGGVFLPGGWAAEMERLGFDIFDRLYDDFQLNAKWAEENNCLKCFYDTNPLMSILLKQIEYFEPDIIFIWTGGFFRIDRYHRRFLREALKNKEIKLIGFWGDELPYNETYSSYFGDIDYMFTSNEAYRIEFEKSGIPASVMGSGFDDSISYDLQSKKKYDVIFCGDTGYQKIDHIRRYELLSEIIKKTNIKIFATEPKLIQWRRSFLISSISLFSKLPIHAINVLDRLLSAASSTRSSKVARAVKLALLLKNTRVNGFGFFSYTDHPRGNYFNDKKSIGEMNPGRVSPGPLEASQYYNLLASAKIIVNIHRDEEADFANIRCFEATGLGAVLLTDRAEGLSTFFDVSSEIITFNDASDCIIKIQELLNDPARLDTIARNGQQRTLKDHRIRNRCELIAPIIKNLHESGGNKIKKNRVIIANWDTSLYPISYDIAFFVEAMEIHRQQLGASNTIINILYPEDIKNIKGVPEEADRAVDLHGRQFRITHICGQIARMFNNVSVCEIRNRATFLSINNNYVTTETCEFISFPGKEQPHHTEYYRKVNANPELVAGFKASQQARRYVEEWTSNFLGRKRLITISLRYYGFDPQRNSNLIEWKKFADSLNSTLYEVVVVPDTDQIRSFNKSPLGKYRAFWMGCFDVDLRYALYESAYLNLFVNNGPGTAASLNKSIRLLMFKLVVSGVPHCTTEFIEWSGFKAGESPPYATPFQKWVWEDDNEPVIKREFYKMIEKIESLDHSSL